MKTIEIIKLQRRCNKLTKINEELGKSEQMYRFLAENSLDVIWQLDEDFRFVYVSPAVQPVFGYQTEELIGRSLFTLLTADSVRKVQKKYEERKALPLEERNKQSFIYTVEAYHKAGYTLWLEVTVNPLLDSQKRSKGFIGVTRDISERRKNEKLMYQYAFYDSLTNLPNRRFFEAMLERAVGEGAKYKRFFAVLFMDIDDFKQVNDRFGHNTGDFLLQVLAERFRRTLRAKDFAARLAGDEFVAILSDLSEREEAYSIANRLLHYCLEPITREDSQVEIGISIGLSFFPDDAEGAADLIAYADHAMYAAKRSGGRTYLSYAK